MTHVPYVIMDNSCKMESVSQTVTLEHILMKLQGHVEIALFIVLLVTQILVWNVKMVNLSSMNIVLKIVLTDTTNHLVVVRFVHKDVQIVNQVQIVQAVSQDISWMK